VKKLFLGFLFFFNYQYLHLGHGPAIGGNLLPVFPRKGGKWGTRRLPRNTEGLPRRLLRPLNCCFFGRSSTSSASPAHNIICSGLWAGYM
jgi:hypothetical protein